MGGKQPRRFKVIGGPPQLVAYRRSVAFVDPLIVIDYFDTDSDALVADVDFGSGNEFLYLVLALCAERTSQDVIISTLLSHIPVTSGNITMA